VVTIPGALESGKTTLARMTLSSTPCILLGDLDTRLAAEAHPQGFLGQTKGGHVVEGGVPSRRP